MNTKYIYESYFSTFKNPSFEVLICNYFSIWNSFFFKDCEKRIVAGCTKDVDCFHHHKFKTTGASSILSIDKDKYITTVFLK